MKETQVETDSQHERLAALLRERTAWRGPSPELDQIVTELLGQERTATGEAAGKAIVAVAAELGHPVAQLTRRDYHVAARDLRDVLGSGPDADRLSLSDLRRFLLERGDPGDERLAHATRALLVLES